MGYHPNLSRPYMSYRSSVRHLEEKRKEKNIYVVILTIIQINNIMRATSKECLIRSNSDSI